MWFSQNIFHGGILFEASSIRLAWARGAAEGIQVDRLVTFSKESREGALLLKKALEKGIVGDAVLTGAVDSGQVLMRKLQLPVTQPKEVEEVYAYEAEQLLPYPGEEAVVTYEQVESQSSGTLITIFAVKRDYLSKELKEWDKWGVVPERVSAYPVALAALGQLLLPDHSLYFIFYVGATQSCCVLVKEGKAMAASASSLGEADLGQEGGVANLVQWLTQARFSLSKQVEEAESADFVFFGEAVASEERRVLLEEKLNKPSLPPAFDRVRGALPDEVRTFAVPIGLALLGEREKHPDFRKGEFAYPYLWKRALRALSRTFVLGLVLALALLAVGTLSLRRHMESIREGYANLEKVSEVMSLNPQDDYQEADAQDLLFKLSDLRQGAESEGELFSLYPNVPKVSDVLAWLNTLAQGRGIEMKRFSYRMVKRPTRAQPQESYQAQVELEIVAASPQQAREFHESLLEDNPIVDQTGRVSWSVSAGRYLASFRLKELYIPRGSR